MDRKRIFSRLVFLLALALIIPAYAHATTRLAHAASGITYLRQRRLWHRSKL